jgi:hypothetical protein
MGMGMHSKSVAKKKATPQAVTAPSKIQLTMEKTLPLKMRR